MNGNTRSRFGEWVKDIRLSKRISLREFCRELDYDPSNWSKIERGMLAPPEDEDRLSKIGEILGLRSDMEEWRTLHDLAALDKGLIPQDILGDEELVEALPLFFRTIRGEKPERNELLKFIEKLRHS